MFAPCVERKHVLEVIEICNRHNSSVRSLLGCEGFSHLEHHFGLNNDGSAKDCGCWLLITDFIKARIQAGNRVDMVNLPAKTIT